MRTPLLAAALASLVVAVHGQSAAVPSPLFRALEEPLPAEAGWLLLAADFDNDGDQDLLCGSGVWLNTGRGRFRPLAGSLALGWTEDRSIIAVDVDGNGTKDIVARRPYSPFEVWSNAGGAIFVPVPQTITGSGSASSTLAQGDMDGDGDVDVVLSEVQAGATTVRLLSNNGAGVFAATTLLSNPFPLPVILVLDVDADGDRDIVALSQAYTTRIVLINSGGVFANSGIPLGAAQGVSAACTGDFDGDGFKDIAIARSSGPAGIEIHLVRPGAAFASTFTPGTGTIQQFFAMDCDGDGRDDLVTCAPGALGSIRLVAPNGTLAAPVATIPASFAAAIAADVDGDADVDLVEYGTRHAIHLNTSQSGYLDMPWPLEARMTSVHARDVEGDGLADIVGASPDAVPGIVTAFNDGSGGFRSGAVLPAFTITHQARDWALADIDGDGDRDLWRAGSGVSVSDAIVINGGTSWSAGLVVSSPGQAWVVKAVDLDLDGDVDFAVARSAPNPDGTGPTLHFNFGGGAMWSFGALPASNVCASDIAVADADGDGDRDVFVASAPEVLPSQSALWRRGPYGIYTRDAGFAAPPGVGVAAADLDGDGDTDCVFGGQVLRNVGGAVFTPAGSLAGGDPGRLAVADLDGDGDPDLVSAFAWFANLGGLAFAPAEPLESAWAPIAGPLAPPRREWPRAPDVFDLDRDGDLDVVAPNGRIFFNLRSQLARGDLAAPGRVASLEVWGPPGSPFVLAAAAAPAAIPFGPAGLLLLEPSTIGFLTTGMLSPGGGAVFAAMVPAVPAYAGATIYWQAWVAASNRLSNLEPMTVLAP